MCQETYINIYLADVLKPTKKWLNKEIKTILQVKYVQEVFFSSEVIFISSCGTSNWIIAV